MTAAINSTARRVPVFVVYLLGLVPACVLIWKALTGGLGADPVLRLEHELGIIGLQFLVASLVFTPLARLARVNLIRFRRGVGILAFVYVSLHLLTWVVLDMGLLWGQMGADILKRPYITVGMVAFVALLPLALTSNDWSLRKLGGARWRQIHWLAYPATLLAAVHYIMVQKVWEIEPLLYLTAILILLATRKGRLVPQWLSLGRSTGKTARVGGG